jgi:hypothetical protein
MNRRTFMTTGAWVSAAGYGWSWMACAASTRNAIAVVDTSLAAGRAFSRAAGRRAMPVFETGDDIGALWYATLAPRLAASQDLLIGLTRSSDYFVLGELARRSGRMIVRSEPCAGAHASVVFLMGPGAT